MTNVSCLSLSNTSEEDTLSRRLSCSRNNNQKKFRHWQLLHQKKLKANPMSPKEPIPTKVANNKKRKSQSTKLTTTEILYSLLTKALSERIY